jgi:hypothetical protein
MKRLLPEAAMQRQMQAHAVACPVAGGRSICARMAAAPGGRSAGAGQRLAVLVNLSGARRYRQHLDNCPGSVAA